MYTADEYIKCLEGLSKKSSNEGIMTTTINTTNPDEKSTKNKCLITEYLSKMGSNTNIKKTKSQEFSNINTFLNLSHSSTKRVNPQSIKSPRLVYQKHRQDSFMSASNFHSTIIKKKALSPQPHLRKPLCSPIRKEHFCANCEILSVKVKRLEKTVKDLNFRVQHSKQVSFNSFKPGRLDELLQENNKLKAFKEKVIEMSKAFDTINSNLNSFVQEVKLKLDHVDLEDKLELVSNQYENIYKELDRSMAIKHREYLTMLRQRDEEINALRQKLKGASQKDQRVFR